MTLDETNVPPHGCGTLQYLLIYSIFLHVFFLAFWGFDERIWVVHLLVFSTAGFW